MMSIQDFNRSCSSIDNKEIVRFRAHCPRCRETRNSFQMLSAQLNSKYYLFFFIAGFASAIKCYRCSVAPSMNKSMEHQVCAKFEETDDFVVDCPFSTMCMKKIYRYQLMDGKTIETVSRNCASQKNTQQVRIESKRADN